MAQASNHRKRSLTVAIRPYQNLECAPPAKKIRLQLMNEQEMSTDHRNDTKFIVGCDKTEFHVIGSLFSNQSEFLRQLIDSNKTNGTAAVCIKDIESTTFQFIVDFVYLKKPLLTFQTVADILATAVKYKIFQLIECCKQKLGKINGNIDDWYHIMFCLEHKAALKPFTAYFIGRNPFHDIHRLLLDPRFAQLTICSITQFIAHYPRFEGESMKLLAIYRYLQPSIANKKEIYQAIRKHFMHMIDGNALSKWAKNSSSGDHNDKLLIEVIHQIQSDSDIVRSKGNQANSRKSIPCTPKQYAKHCNISASVLENENDKKKRNILRKYGFKNCTKIQASGRGSVWRAMCSKSGESVVIKTALHLYKKDIIKEAHILRELNEKQMHNTSDIDIKNGIIRLMDVIEEQFVHMMILQDGGKDLFEFTRHCHEDIVRGNILISDWQKTSKLIAYKLAKIVSWLHQNNVCHLDISLENILISNVKWIEDKKLSNVKRLSPEFILTLIDFGTAQTLNHNEDTFEHKTRIGKPGYFSPQIFKKCRFSAKAADCWSYGVTLFTLIIGATPWQMPDSDGNKLFQAIVLDKNMDKILKIWKRCNYLSLEMKHLLNKIFVMNENDRASIEIIKHYLQ